MKAPTAVNFLPVEFGGVGLPQVYRHCIIRVCFVSRTRIHQRRTSRNALMPALPIGRLGDRRSWAAPDSNAGGSDQAEQVGAGMGNQVCSADRPGARRSWLDKERLLIGARGPEPGSHRYARQLLSVSRRWFDVEHSRGAPHLHPSTGRTICARLSAPTNRATKGSRIINHAPQVKSSLQHNGAPRNRPRPSPSSCGLLASQRL